MMFSQKIKKIPRQIETVDETAGKFALSMVIYSSNIIKAMDILDNADTEFKKGKMLYQHNLMYMRMLIDCCTEVVAALLVNNKDNFYKHFLDGKPTNQIKKAGQALTKSYLLSELEKDFEGITEIYTECCNWIHPSKATVVRIGKYRKRREEYVGYRGRIYTKMKKEKEDILKDFEYCVDVLYTLLNTLRLYYKSLTKATESETKPL